MSFNDLETRRRQLIAEINNPRTSPERLERLYDEANEVRMQIERHNAGAVLEGVTIDRGRRPGERRSGPSSALSGGDWGRRFVQSEAFLEYRGRGFNGVSHGVEFSDFIDDEMERRALLSGGDGVYTGTGAGALQRPPLQPWVAALNPDRVPRVMNVVGKGTTENSSVDFAQDTSAAGAGGVAAETGEGVIKPETALTFTQKTAPVRTVAHYIPVTRQALDDNPMLQSFIDGRLRYGLLRRIDNQILNGDGTGMNLTGILNTSGIGTYAPGTAEARLISIRKARTIVENSELEANALIVNPSDWEKVDLLTAAGSGEFMAGPGRDLVAEGLLGVPQGSPVIGGQYPTPIATLRGVLWGLQIVVTTAIAAGTGLVGAFDQAFTLYDRQETRVIVSDSHADFLVRNLLAVLAEARVALAPVQPKGVVRITYNGST